MTIYSITVFEKIEERDSSCTYDFGSMRNVGYFVSYKEAEESVLNNKCLMHDELFTYAVIEEVTQGLYPEIHERHYFQYDSPSKKYTRMKPPDFSGFDPRFLFN